MQAVIVTCVGFEILKVRADYFRDCFPVGIGAVILDDVLRDQIDKHRRFSRLPFASQQPRNKHVIIAEIP